MADVAIKICNSCGRQFMTPKDFLLNTSRWRICDQGHLWFNCSCFSTGLILKGKFPWYDPTARISIAGESILNKIPSIRAIPRIPHFVMELQQLLENENATTNQMAGIVRHDSMLATSILKLANQMRPRGSEAIRSISHAIAFAGIKSLKDMVTVAAVNRFQLHTKDFNSDRFWDESFLVGRIAEFLLHRLQLPFSADQAFLAGSCCNVGKVVLAICLPDTADKFHREMQDISILGSWTDAERRHQGFQHTILGEIGAAFWGFPDEYLDSICRHHEAPAAPDSSPALWELVGFANQLAHWVNLEPNQMDQKLLNAQLQRFQLSMQQTEGLVEEMLAKIRTV